jgi:hypothetical protein
MSTRGVWADGYRACVKQVKQLLNEMAKTDHDLDDRDYVLNELHNELRKALKDAIT